MSSFETAAVKKASCEPEPGAAEYQKAFFDKLDATVAKCNALGSSLIVGIKNGDDDDEDEDEEEEEDDDGKEKIYTKDQIDSLRHIIITKNRDAMLTKALDMVTCGQAGDFCMTFNTQDGNEVIDGITRMIKSAKDKKTPTLRFDALLALTIAINQYDNWACDNEMSGEGMEMDTAMKALGKYWSTLLSHTDEELGIDSEFTRPGVEALLAKFKDNMDDYLTGTDCAPFTYDLHQARPASGAKKRKDTADA